MLRAIARSRCQAVSAGLVAGTFFSKGCVDHNYSATDADAGSAIIEELASAPEPEITPVIYPCITTLPLASTERPTARETGIKKSSNTVFQHKSERVIETTKPELEERPILVDEQEAVAEPVLSELRQQPMMPSELQRQPMMQDAYAAFGAQAIY